MKDETTKPMTDEAWQAQISSPISTGGEGVFFEQHVGAYWLAQLVVRSIPPILTDATVSEVHFQTEHLGFNTDDILVVCERSSAATARLAMQVKRSFTVSASDDECKKTIGDFWKDFKRAEPFNPELDRLLLVTLRGTNTLLQHFVGILDAARSAADGDEFERRLSLDGFISKKSIRQCNDLCQIVGELEGAPVTAKEIWPFICVLHVLSLDLHTSTSQTEAQIKSLLALKSTKADPIASATSCWHALLDIASSASPAARSLKRTDLPRELLEAHTLVGADEHSVLAALRSHTEFVLGKVRMTIGLDFHLHRTSMIQKVLEAIETHQVVVIAGPAGSGKSVIGKEVTTFLSRNHFAFGFRVEEFARAHIDETLQVSQIPATAKRMQAILAAQDRKLLVIESMERLLEKPTRDAFSDLMMLAGADSGIRILMTCRSYSVEQVRASFLQPAGMDHAIIEVPPLGDRELEEVQTAFPSLAVPFANPALKNILRNPYFIDKALEISWIADHPVPENERDFRALFWEQIVRGDDRPAKGMPRRREQALQEIAVRRARALSDYVLSTGIDPVAVGALKQDSLVASPRANPLLVATAHDVLEDWAILQWIEEQQLAEETPFRALSLAIGSYPAVRRSYRKWVAELVGRDPISADRLFTSAVGQADVPVQFRDDTLVSLLKAPSAPEFLARHEVELIVKDLAILKKVIHLLRVACVCAPAWVGEMRGCSSIFNVPEGPAWPTVLQLTHRNIDRFAPEDRPLLLGLIEDAVRGVSSRVPDLEGGEHAAGIAHWLLPRFGGYRSEDSRKRTLKVIAKIPNADPARFEAVLRGQIRDGELRDRVADEFREILICGLDGWPAARDLADILVSVTLEALLATEDCLRKPRYAGMSHDVNLHFGIKEHLRYDFFPASAFRGPWVQLLTYHPEEGLDFLIKLFNHSVDWYVHPRVQDRLEPAWQVELRFADGTTRKQWVNGRLWGLYRGFTVGPYALQSLLMALENWLLDYAKADPDGLDAMLLEILKRSESAALSAVVASVATAYPKKAGETVLALLSVHDYIDIDRSRMANEHQSQVMSGLFPNLRADHKVYEQERKKSDALPHRRLDLEAAIGAVQFGPFAPRVHAIIDRHLGELPPAEARNKDDIIWQLALHRMDLRQYDVTEAELTQEVADTPQAGEESGKKYLRLVPKPPSVEVQKLIDEGTNMRSALSARLDVYSWGLQVFQYKSGSADPSQWRDNLAAAQTMKSENTYSDNSHNGPGFVAAVCVRDHWNEMPAEQQEWCVNVVCSEISKQADKWKPIDRVQRFSMLADRPCAFVAPALLCKALTEAQAARVREAFVVALLHPIDEVSWHAVWGIDERFWAANPAVAFRAVNAVAREATIADQVRRSEKRRSYKERTAPEKISEDATRSVRQIFWEQGGLAEEAHVRLGIFEKYEAEASTKILTMLGQVPDNPLALAAFMRASKVLVECWNNDHVSSNRHDRDYQHEQVVADRIQRFVARASDADADRVLQPILDAVERHPREVSDVIQGLTNIEDSQPNTAHYWFLWSLFAERVKHANWISHLEGEHPHGSEVLSKIFLTAWWKDNVRHWRSLEGYAQHVDHLFDALPPSWIVLDSYVRFLYHVGERSLPAAFGRLAKSFNHGNALGMLRSSNTVFMLEDLLQRHVYPRPLELKRDSVLRDAILFLLDTLVDHGSSAAFRMRDDFVTPAA